MGILSQPLSRGAALFGVIAVGVAISGCSPEKQRFPLQLNRFVHLLSIAMVVGIGDWTTFVFGIVAFKNLPRQTFGQLQAKLFPKYFQVHLALSYDCCRLKGCHQQWHFLTHKFALG